MITPADAPTTQASRTAWRALWACILGNLCLRASSLSTSIMLGLYLSYINAHVHPVSAIQVGTIGIGYYTTEFLGATPLGALSDRFGRKPFIVVGLIAGACAVQLYPLTTLVPVIFVILMLEGFGAAASTPATLGFLADATVASDRMRSKATSFFELGTLGGMLIGYVAGGVIWDRLSATGFHFIALGYLLGLAIIVWRLDEQIKPIRRVVPTWAHYLRVLLAPAVVQLIPAWIAMQAILGVFFSQTAFQLSSRAPSSGQALLGGFSGTEIGGAFAVLGLVFASGVFVWGNTLRHWHKVSRMLLATSGGGLSALGLFLLNHSSLHAGASLEIILLFVLVAAGVFVQSGFAPVALAYLADISEGFASDRGTIMGLYSILLALGQVLGSILGGIFAQWARFDGVILIASLLAVIAFFNILRMALAQGRSQEARQSEEGQS